jgi:hypothetical protein
VENQTEFVTSELKGLVGRGAKPKWLARCPELRKLAGVVKEDAPVVEAGYAVLRHLAKSISGLSGSYEFEGKVYTEHQMKRAYSLLLAVYEGKHLSAEERREKVIVNVLRFMCSVDHWRKPLSLEWDFLYILAQHLTGEEPPNLQI